MASHRTQSTGHPCDRLLGTSLALVTLRAQIQQLVRFDTPGQRTAPALLLQGETGTGKGLVARVVHDSGPRAASPFVEINCATLPETMLEAELFGFEAGAFTDAKRTKPGLFEAAAGGTLFLDEIDAVPLALQSKLLTALESKRVRRLGAVADRVVDVKLITATNMDLGHAVTAGRLRADLYHRLAVVVLTLPPLRERGTDVLLLAEALLAQLAAAHGLLPKRLRADAVQWLQQYAWPGNVRELRHLLERVMLLHSDEVIDAATLAHWCLVLPDTTRESVPLASDAVSALPEPAGAAPPALPPEAVQLQEALVRAGGNVSQAARLLGLSREQLRTRMRRHQLTRPPLTPLTAPQVDAAQGLPVPPPAAPSPIPEAVAPRTPLGAESPEDQVSATPVVPQTPPVTDLPEAERRHLTVLFADLVDSTALASSMDPEDWQEVLQAYHTTCVDVMAQFAGHVAQYLGDGVLVYFGYPQAHEDDAQRAVWAGLALVAAMARLRVQEDLAVRLDHPLEVRIGIHTGLVVIDAVGAAGRQEVLALGEAPHVAARLQSVAAPGTVVCSAVTAQLVRGYVTLEALEAQALKGLATPVQVYQVRGASGVRSRLEASGTHGLTPLVGRDPEVALLQERWNQVQEGYGQVVVLSGEAGIGKSRLVQVVQEQVVGTAATPLVVQGSPYHQHHPFYPVITSLERALRFEPGEPEGTRVQKLEQALAAADLPLHDVVPVLATLLALPLPLQYPPLSLLPQQLKQRTLDTLVLWVVQQATRHPVLLVVEDLHWIDPSTLEWFTLVLDQVPTAPVYAMCACRPEFALPWAPRAHLTPLTLPRLRQAHVEAMVQEVAGGKRLPAEVVQRVVSQTDGVPLFVEELTKMLLESDLLAEGAEAYTLRAPLPPRAIPTTLQDSLMARLDRLGTAKAVAQLGATIGRQFPYAVLQAVAPRDEDVLQQELTRLVATELLYQRGVPPQATYMFKHALIQEVAYTSLLKRTRQQYHRQIAQVLETQFPDIAATQPALLAQHYTEAGLPAQAVVYWQRAGQQANERSAHQEAIQHLNTGLDALKTLPTTPAQLQHELALQTSLGAALLATQGYTAPEVERVYTRARQLCQQLGETPALFPVLFGLLHFYLARAEPETARELGEQIMRLGQRTSDVTLRLQAHLAMAYPLQWLGEFVAARQHFEQAMALYDPRQHRALAFLNGEEPGVVCLSRGAKGLWLLGYPDQALANLQRALALAREQSHPSSQALCLYYAGRVHQYQGEVQQCRDCATALITMCTEQRFPHFLHLGRMLRGWTLVQEGQAEEGIVHMQQGQAAYRAIGSMAGVAEDLTHLAACYWHVGDIGRGRAALAEALATVQQSGERLWEAEMHRLQGVLLLALPGENQAEGEACLRRALDVARHQQAKSLELRATISLCRLWQQQGKRAEAHQLLAPIYGWFTEGFDTADLQEAKALLAALA